MESTQARSRAGSSSGTETSFLKFNTQVFRTDGRIVPFRRDHLPNLPGI